MKVVHHKLSHVRKKFFDLNDLASVTRLTRILNNKSIQCSKDVCDFLSDYYVNLESVPIKVLIYDGGFETTHWVNVTRDRKFIIDTTGDRFDFINFNKFKREVTPWVYRKAANNDVYVASHHMPSNMPSGLSHSYQDWDLVAKSRSPFYKGVRFIYI